MRVTLTSRDGLESVYTQAARVVIEESSPLYPTNRKSLIERVNALLDQCERKDARPI